MLFEIYIVHQFHKLVIRRAELEPLLDDFAIWYFNVKYCGAISVANVVPNLAPAFHCLIFLFGSRLIFIIFNSTIVGNPVNLFVKNRELSSNNVNF